jgi:hypothetical protein
MTIFEALRQSHERQRELGTQLLATRGDTAERQELFGQLKQELLAHETAEERHFYLLLIPDDLGVDVSRHAIAEHHEMDEMVEELEELEASSPAWLPRARKLVDKIHHHLEEEEHKFFQMAGKVLDEQQKLDLAGAYLREYESLKGEAA